jgi:hypothetical protein
MSDRQLKLLFGVLVVVFVAWAIARFVFGRSDSSFDSSQIMTNLEFKIDSMVVTSADETVRLRGGAMWTVNGHEAVPEAGASLEQALLDVRLGQQVSRNPENHARMGVDDASGRRLEIYVGDSDPLTLILGDRAGAFDEYYVRRPGEDEVYVLRGGLVNLANRGVDDWRDREIFAAERASVQRIEFTYPDESFALARDSAGWRLDPSGAPAEIAAVSPLLEQLTALRAISFAADSVSETLEWDPPAVHLRVTGLGGAGLGELLFLENEEIGYFVRRNGSAVVYTISSYTGDQIVVREAELAAELME